MSWPGIYTTIGEYEDDEEKESMKEFQLRKASEVNSERSYASSAYAPEDPLVVVKKFMDTVISVSHRKHEQQIDQVRE